MKALKHLLPLVAVLSTAPVHGQSPWLPPAGEFSLNPSYTFDTFDDYWFGQKKADVPFGDVDHHAILAGVEYGLLEDLALDATLGYIRTVSSRTDADDSLDDTTFGARYRVADEMEADYPFYVPTLTVRLGGIIEGTYFQDNLEVPGKAASGFEGSILVGKVLGDSGFRVSGDAGYRVYGNSVPDDYFLGIGVAKSIFDALELSLSWRHIQSLSGPDVDDAGFQDQDFTKRREVSDTVEIGIGYQTLDGRYFGVRLGKTVAGRNTGEKFILGFSAFIPF